MADTRLLCAMIIAVLIAVSTAKPAAHDGQKDTAELKQLLGAMKRYLHDATDDQNQRKSSRLNAHDDVRVVYDESTSASEVHEAETSGAGKWTQWLDVDQMAMYGTGEFEDCRRVEWDQGHRGKCFLGCKSPRAARYALVQETDATWTEIENCVGPMDSSRVTSCGFKCLNSDARYADKSNCKMDQCRAFGLSSDCTRCPNIRVQFFCMGQQPDASRPCPRSSDSGVSGRYSLRSSLAVFRTDEEKRDVIANILHEVEDVLEPSN